MAERIARLLQAKNGGNASEMARFCNVSPQAVQKWLAGDSDPRGKNLEAAAVFLGVKPAYLKFGDEQKAAEIGWSTTKEAAFDEAEKALMRQAIDLATNHPASMLANLIVDFNRLSPKNKGLAFDFVDEMLRQQRRGPEPT